MEHGRYQWKRFWYPRNAPIQLGNDGYLPDPDARWGAYLNPEAVAFEELESTPCLVLLGEPGLGKSDTLAVAHHRSEREAIDTGDSAAWFDLHAYQSDSRLERAILEDATVRNWLAGSHRLYLYLDSLDEALLRIDTVTDLLAQILSRLPLERLHLRIACRSDDWSLGFECTLKQLWRAKRDCTYTLAPLRRVDVAAAARMRGIDDGAFLAEVERIGAVPLAIKPITLEFLFKSFQRDGGLPRTQRDVYARGCELLCEESNRHRRETRRTGVHTAGERLAAASCLAAVTVFSNRYAVWTDLDMGEVPEADVPVHEVIEAIGGGLDVQESAIRAALATGLFSAPNASERNWAHQTYAEYLAARFVTQRMTLRQVLNLLLDSDGKLVPQLRTVAAWIAVMMPETFDVLAMADPEGVLRADVTAADEARRACLVAALLATYEAEETLDRDPALWRRYATLSHPGLADQLRPYITNSAKGIIARRVAIDVAAACKLQTLQTDLMRLALDPNEPPHLRSRAVDAVAAVGDPSTLVKLRPFVFGEAGDDPDDDLKGYALRALWPEHLSAPELFTALTPPMNEHYFGAYAAFLRSGFEEYLQSGDLVTALGWAEQYAMVQQWGSDLHGAVDRVLLKAWNHLEREGVVEAFARATLARLSSHQAIVTAAHVSAGRDAGSDDDEMLGQSSFADSIRRDERRRRSVLEAMLRLLIASDADPFLLIYSDTPVVTADDVLWLIERLRPERSEAVASVLARLIAHVTDLSDPDQLDVILVASGDIPALVAQYRWLLTPVPLDSPEAEQMRARYCQEQELAVQRAERTSERIQSPFQVPPQVEDLLGRCETGEVSAWWRLNMLLSITPEGRLDGAELTPDVTALPAWEACDVGTQERLVKAARRYVLEQDPLAEGWLAPSKLRLWMGQRISIFRPAFAGYRALMLLQRRDPETVHTLGEDIWRRWASILVSFPSLPGDAAQESHDVLIRAAYGYAADEIIATFLAQCKQQDHETGTLYGLHRVSACWDDLFSDAVVTAITRRQFRPGVLQALLIALIDHGSPSARVFAKNLINGRRRGRVARQRAAIAAAVLLTQADDAGWSVVWPVFQQDSTFGREVLLSLHRFPTRQTSIAERLSDEHVADLFIYVASLFPPSEDPPLPNGFVTDEHHIAMWRSSLVSQLPQRRTLEACRALRRIVQAYPQEHWLKLQLREAEDLLRYDTWRPASPETIIKLATNRDRRLVENGDQLLDVILESFARLEQELQGETPAVSLLWNDPTIGGKKVYAPKDEATLSNYVKLHLERDLQGRGIIANREVEVRTGMGARGERTDVHVDAIIRRPGGEKYNPVTVIIEVKGCWNRDVMHAMETQLAIRYLKDNQCRHGLYLVGWYRCQQWDDADPRKSATPRLSIEEARERFTYQAVELSARADLGIQVKSYVLNTSLR